MRNAPTILVLISITLGIVKYDLIYAIEEGKAESLPVQKKALLEADIKKGIKLSSLGQKTLELKFMGVTHQPVQTVPNSALVYYQDKVGIYRYQNEYFKLVGVDLISSSGVEVKIKSNELTFGDQIVTQGVPLLRVAELDACAGPDNAD